MEEKFKAYLEEQFKQIAPTKAAMEYRISMLRNMMDRAQELRIKGMNDDELIYATVITELGDFSATLKGYENRVIKKEVNQMAAVFAIAVAVAWVLPLVIVYLIVGFVTRIWHPTWLIIVAGTLAGIAGILIWAAVRLNKSKSYLPLRAVLVGIEVILSVIVFLFLQLVGNVRGSFMTFLAMTALIFATDTAMAFASGSKIKWLELPVSIEVFCVMLYVMLGISLSYKGISVWHPAWLMCLAGVIAAMAEGLVMLARLKGRRSVEMRKNTAVDESYWSKWE